MISPKIIVALDHTTDQQALDFLLQLDPKLCRIKIGSILFTHYGPTLIEKIIQRGFSVFLDLKFHDIPQTVAGACYAAAELGVWMVNVHISGGAAMLAAAREALQNFPSAHRPWLIGVTVLTSLNDEDLAAVGFAERVEQSVVKLARLAKTAGLDGVVCSGHEAVLLRQQFPKDFLLVVPGIRLPGDAQEDQKRLMTPQQALQAGADYLVIGRSITRADNPQQALLQTLNFNSN
jgi:orotidine-5'-phosphate decarboxylase